MGTTRGVAADTAAAWAPAIVATGPQSAAAIFRETVAGAPVIRVARTIDGGASWLAPVTISSPDAAAVTRATVAALGQTVDAVWSQGADCFAGHCEIRYARSSDGGATFGSSVRLSSAKGMAGQAAVARSGLTVVVTWTDAPSGKVLARVSIDGARRSTHRYASTPRPTSSTRTAAQRRSRSWPGVGSTWCRRG